jgi:hypothetical protein
MVDDQKGHHLARTVTGVSPGKIPAGAHVKIMLITVKYPSQSAASKRSVHAEW